MADRDVVPATDVELLREEKSQLTRVRQLADWVTQLMRRLLKERVTLPLLERPGELEQREELPELQRVLVLWLPQSQFQDTLRLVRRTLELVE